MWHLAVISKEQGIGVVVQSQKPKDLLYQNFHWFKKSRSEFTRLLLQHTDDSVKTIFSIKFDINDNIDNISFGRDNPIETMFYKTCWFYFYNIDTQEMLFYKNYIQCDKHFRELRPEDRYEGIL